MYNFVKFFSAEMNTPTSYGLFHFICIFITLAFISIIFINRNKYQEKDLNKVLLFYSIIALILEIIKQIIWSYDLETRAWSYSWYSAPFQLCTTPIYASLIAVFTKNKKLKNSMLSYIAYITIVGSLATFIYPESCFTSTIEVNIHTMFLHCGSLVLSIYLLTNVIEKKISSFISSIYSFLGFELIALLLNIVVYNLKILGDNTFNMFYISPYFISPLPIMGVIQENTFYIIFLIFYNIVIIFGGFIIYLISKKLAGKTYKK